MWRLGSLIVVIVMTPLLAQAAQWTNVTKENSKIWIDDIPGMEAGRIVYQYQGWNQSFSAELSHAGAFVNGTSYPRLQVYLEVLAPGYLWIEQNALDEKWIRSLTPFFKDRALHVIDPDSGGGSAAVRKVRFDVDRASCVAFSIGGTPASGQFKGLAIGHNTRTFGYYCAGEGEPLTDADVQTILSRISITERPDQTRIRLAQPPAGAASELGHDARPR